MPFDEQFPLRQRRGVAWAVLALGAAGFLYDLIRLAVTGTPSPEWFLHGAAGVAAPWAGYLAGLALTGITLHRRWPVVLAPAFLSLIAWMLTAGTAGRWISLPVLGLTAATLGLAPAVAVALAAMEFGELSLRPPIRRVLVIALAVAGLLTSFQGLRLIALELAPLRPTVNPAGIPEREFRDWIFQAHGALNDAVFKGDPAGASAEMKDLAAWYRSEGRARLRALEKSATAEERANLDAFRGDLDRALAEAERGFAGDGEALIRAHRILHDLDVHLIGTRRAPDYFGASRLLERVRRESGSNVQVGQPDRKELLVLLYLLGVATEALWGTAFVLWRDGKRLQPSG